MCCACAIKVVVGDILHLALPILITDSIKQLINNLQGGYVSVCCVCVVKKMWHIVLPILITDCISINAMLALFIIFLVLFT